MDAKLSRTGGMYVLSLERRLAHPPEKVWRAITHKELLHQWFPAHVIGEWTVGAPLVFEFQHGEGDGLSEEELRGEVLAVEAGRLLEFRWGQHVLRCELVCDGEGTRLLFSESFPDSSWGARNAAGWEHCLESLERVVGGGAPQPFDAERWRTRFEHYAALLGPDFGPQAGPPDAHAELRSERTPGP